MHQGGSKVEENYVDYDDGDVRAKSDGKEKIKSLNVQVSCTPYGSTLKKPTDFFRKAFTIITKPFCEEFDLNKVSYLRDDIFLVEVSIKYLDGMWIK